MKGKDIGHFSVRVTKNIGAAVSYSDADLSMSYLSNTSPLLRLRVNGGCPDCIVYLKTDNA